MNAAPRTVGPPSAPTPLVAPSKAPGPPKFDFASRLFGYDVFISFALGPPPRGSQSYASDLARRLRERDFKVFYSEEEASPGEQLDGTLRKALHGSRALVVIANRGTLTAPRWVRTEVESFRSLTPERPIVPISIGGALQDPDLAPEVAPWLPFKDRIWIDETQEAADSGLASAAVVDRLALVPRRVRSNVKWRWLVRTVGAALVLLAVGMGIAAKVASDNEKRARAELMRSVSLRSAAEAQAMVAGVRAGGHERALQQVLAAHVIGSAPVEVGGAMLSLIIELPRALKLLDTGAVIRAAAFSPEAGVAQVVTGGAGGRVQRWDARTLQPIGGPLPGPQSEVFAVAYSPDGQRIAAGDLGGRLWLWNARSGESLPRSADEGGGAIRSLAFMPDGRRIVSGGVGGALRFWDSQSGEPQGEPLHGIGEVITAVAISPDGQRIVSGGDYHAQLWTLRRGRWDSVPLDAPGEDMPGWVYAVAFSPDGQRVASGSADGFVRLWDGTTGKPAGDPLRAKAGVTSIRFSHDGAQLLSGSARGTLELWNLQERRSVAEWLKNQDGAVTALSFSADGRLAVSGGEDGMLRLWNAAPEPTIGEAQAGATPPQPTPNCDRPGTELPETLRSSRVLAWSPDCALAAAGRVDTLQLIDVRSGEPLGQPLAGHKTGEVRDANAQEPKINVVSVALSGDGRYVISGSENGSVQRWQTSPLRPEGEPLLGHRNRVVSVALSPDGLTIASVDDNGQLRLWERQSGQPIGSPLADTSEIRRVAFSADGTQVVALEKEGMLRSWPAPVSWQARLCEKLTRDMSPDQWRTWLTPEIAFMQQCDRSAEGAAERR
jgi:WD40 repeat protein